MVRVTVPVHVGNNVIISVESGEHNTIGCCRDEIDAALIARYGDKIKISEAI